MKLAFPSALLLLLISKGNAWSFGLTPYGLSRQLLWQDPVDLIEANRALIDRAFGNLDVSSPRWEMVNDPNTFKLTLDVPGVKPEDVNVTIEDKNRVVEIKGSRKVTKDGYQSSMEFHKAFTVDPSVDLEHFTASLEDGVLVITAPKDSEKTEETTRKIPVLKNEVNGDLKIGASKPNAQHAGETADLDKKK